MDKYKLPEFLTVSEVAKILRLKRSTCYDYILKGYIPSIKLGHQLRIRRDVIEKLGAPAF